jgi:hypothetical protein
MILLAVAFGASGSVGVAGGASALVFQNIVSASLGGTADACGDVKVSASSDSKLFNIAAAAGIGGTAGVTGVAVVTYFYNKTSAFIKSGAVIRAIGDILVRAASKEFVTADAAGASGSGTASVGGTLDVVVSRVTVKAYTENGVFLKGRDVSVTAADDYDLIAVVGTISVSGVAGVGVSVLAAVFYNTVTAEIGDNNRVEAANGILVKATSDRLINAYVFTVGGGEVGVSGTVAVVTAGSKLNKDANDGIYISEGGYSAMDPEAQTEGAFSYANSSAASSKPNESLDDLLAGDGQSADDLDVDGNSYGQNTGGTAPDDSAMNDELYDETSGISRNKATGATVRGAELKDTASAIVRTGSQLIAGGNIEVLSGDNINADIIAGTQAVGLYAGVGAGVAVAVLY